MINVGLIGYGKYGKSISTILLMIKNLKSSKFLKKNLNQNYLLTTKKNFFQLRK